jgi:hypothetical protein
VIVHSDSSPSISFAHYLICWCVWQAALQVQRWKEGIIHWGGGRRALGPPSANTHPFWWENFCKWASTEELIHRKGISNPPSSPWTLKLCADGTRKSRENVCRTLPSCCYSWGAEVRMKSSFDNLFYFFENRTSACVFEYNGYTVMST